MKEISTYIFDMDGTLYQIDGSPKGFSGSSLESSVIQNAKQYVQQQENCTQEVADGIVQEGLRDNIGLSKYFSKRYGISRDEYFKMAWNISPEVIVQNFEIAVEVIKTLKQEEKYLILLTSAPEIWQQIVIGFIGLLSYFDEVYTGEKFGSKSEIFELLANRFDPNTTMSVGDQQKTDIEPAAKFGMQTFLVSMPADLKQLALSSRTGREEDV